MHGFWLNVLYHVFLSGDRDIPGVKMHIKKEEKELTGKDFDTAFKVLEIARERANKDGIKHEKELFNNAHHFLQEYQGLLKQEEKL